MSLTITSLPAASPRGAVFRLEGRLSAVTAQALKDQIKQAAAAGRGEIVLEMSGVSFVDSSGLSALVSGLKVTREADGLLRLAGLNDQVLHLFRLTLLDRVFEFYPDLETAVRGLGE